MARVERVSSAQPIPVERAQLISPGAFPFSYESAETLKQIGGVLEELGQRKREAQDRIGISNANAAMENAEREYQLEIIGKPLEEHAAILIKHRNNAMTSIGQQRFSPEVRTFAENKARIWGNGFADAGEIATIKALERDAIIAVTTDYEKALAEGDPEDIIEAEAALDAQFKSSYAPAEAKVLKEKAEQRAIKQMEENAISAVHEAIEAENFQLARELAKSELIPEPRQTTLRNTIDSAEKAVETAAKIEQQKIDDEIGEEFLGLLVNKLNPASPQLTFNAIATSDLSLDAKDAWLTKLRVFDNYSEGELKEAFADQGNVLADIYDKIDNNAITNNQIRERVGEGLSPTTAQRIIKERRQPYEKDTEQLFKRIFGWTPELGFENDLSGFLYEKALREWQAEVKTQDATGEKIIEIGRSIVRPYFLEHVKTVMPSDTNISRMMELALGEEVEEREPEEIEMPEEKSIEPETAADFETEVARLKGLDMEKARKYYDKWMDKF